MNGEDYKTENYQEELEAEDREVEKEILEQGLEPAGTPDDPETREMQLQGWV